MVGGDGGIGDDGVSINIQITSGDILLTENSSYNLAGMPEIQATYTTCTNVDMTFTNVDMPLGSGTTSWDLSGNATNQNGTINPPRGGFFSTKNLGIINK